MVLPNATANKVQAVEFASGVLVVQSIATKWHKEPTHRSDALKRVVPEALTLPEEALNPGAAHIVHHRFTHNAARQHNVELFLEPALLQVGCVTLVPTANSYVAECRYTQFCGAPIRYWMDRDFLLVPDMWVQVVYNGRFSGWDDYWWYEKNVVNVGLFERVSADAFTREEPAERFAAMARLW